MGGSSSNNGVRFISDRYSIQFKMNRDGTYTATYKKNREISAAGKFFRKIPLLKGLYVLFEMSKPLFGMIALFIVFDIFERDEKKLTDIHPALPVIITAGMIFYIALKLKNIVYNAKLTWQFHGAEHKTIEAYQNNRELTLENVRKCPRIAKRCGTNLAVFLLFFAIALYAVPFYDSLKFLLSFILAYELFDLEKGDELPIIKVFYKVGFWCQQHLFTSEPTDRQIEVSIDTMKKLIALENE